MVDDVLCTLKQTTDVMWTELSNRLHVKLDESITVLGLRIESNMEASLLQTIRAHDIAVSTGCERWQDKRHLRFRP
jgi:hypothetical protein